LQAAERTFCWERQEPALLQNMQDALRETGATSRTTHS
jgi:hypothetical protein